LEVLEFGVGPSVFRQDAADLFDRHRPFEFELDGCAAREIDSKVCRPPCNLNQGDNAEDQQYRGKGEGIMTPPHEINRGLPEYFQQYGLLAVPLRAGFSTCGDGFRIPITKSEQRGIETIARKRRFTVERSVECAGALPREAFPPPASTLRRPPLYRAGAPLLGKGRDQIR
jgi:hypothetical protein